MVGGSNPSRLITHSPASDGGSALHALAAENHAHELDVAFTEIQGFSRYIQLRGYCAGHVAHLTAYFRTLQGRRFSSPAELEAFIKRHPKNQRNIVKVARVYLGYCEKHELLGLDVIAKYRKFLKIERQKPDV